MDHPCIQNDVIKQMSKSVKANTHSIDVQSRALFGDPTKGETGVVADIKEINENIKKMMPVYQDMDSWGTFFKKGRQLGATLVAFALGAGVLVGTLYAIRDWFKH